MSLTPEQIEARRVHLRDQELSGPKHRYWLSFVDPARPRGHSFLGACIVEAHGVVTAAEEAWARKCNPGGELAGWELPDEHAVPPEAMNRLLSRDDIEQYFGPMTTIGELRAEGTPESAIASDGGSCTEHNRE